MKIAVGGGLGLLCSGLSVSRALAAPFTSGRFSVTVRGTIAPGGRDILLIPGLASGPTIWSALVNRLPSNRLHLIHIAGFAHKPAGPNKSGALLAPITDELARYIKSVPLRSPAIIGHSMGGTLAMMLALRRDLPIDRTMVVDMLPEGAGMVGGTAQGMGYLANQLSGYLTGTKAGRQMLAQMVMEAPGAQGSDPQVIAQALAELAQTDLTPRLPSLTRPLQIVYALPADRQTAADQQRRYRAAYSGVRSATLTGIGPSGHAIMLDQPDRFVATVREFLK